MDLLVLLIQLFLEAMVQSLLSLAFDSWSDWWLWPSIDEWFHRDKVTGRRTGFGWYFLFLASGGIVGRISLLVAPHLVLPFVSLRVANLILAPIAAGALSWWAALGRQNRADHFWMSFCFALAFSIVRLEYAA